MVALGQASRVVWLRTVSAPYAHITRLCAPQRMDAEIPAAAHSGGYRAMPAGSDRHAARLAFQRVSVLIADLVQLGRLGTHGSPPRRRPSSARGHAMTGT
jgi:hypothetical protein